MTTARTCPGVDLPVIVYRGGKNGNPEAHCPRCEQWVPIYERGGKRFIGFHLRGAKQ